MKIDDRVYVHGHVDEIRKDTVIIRNKGGYFGTVKSEIVEAQNTEDIVSVIRCKDCKFLRFTGTMWKCQNRLVMMLCEPNDYCSRAERKEAE